MELKPALDKLFSLHTFGIKLGLENIQKFLSTLNNPQNKIKAIHIAGSNGKGSTAAFIASILMECGYKVGLYTSPHFVKFNERIQINTKQIPDEYIANFISEWSGYIDEQKLTFFEVTTAIAFKYFAENKVEFAVIETGLGGRLDATNVLNPLAVVITSISLEHTNILGDTIRKIAFEKAAIIKKQIQVFIGKLPMEAEAEIEEKCRESESKLFKIEDYININENKLELYTEEIELDDWNIPLRGTYQRYNAALACLVVSKILLSDNLKSLSKGIQNVIKNTSLQGRFEYYHQNPDIIFDSAHNPEGIQNFLLEFQRDKNKYSKKILLFGVMKDKSIKEMLSNLQKSFDEIHFAEINVERTCKIEDIEKIAGEMDLKVIPENNPVQFINDFKNIKTKDCLVVLGSMYLLGEIKTFIQTN